MIHDLTGLEPLLHQYDHEKVLVGPLLNLWTNSSFRAFNIAGKSDKIYETIGLGFIELEMDAQRRRADIVASLKGRFGEVENFDNQLEMAQMAHALWANDETARFLATVSWESKPRPTGETRQKRDLDPEPARAPQSADDQISDPLFPGSLSATETFANPGTLSESGSNLEAVGNLPVAVAGSSVSKKYRLWVLIAAYLALCFAVGFLIGTTVFASFTSSRQTANEATFSGDAAASITTGNDPSQAAAAVTHPIPARSIETADGEAQPTEAVHVASPSLPTSQPALPTSQPGVADGEADASPPPRAQPVQNPSAQAEADPDEQLSQSPKAQGDQADESISAPQSSPSQTVKTQSSTAETVPVSVPQPPQVAPTQIFISSASTQIVAGHDGSQLSPSEAGTPAAPEALSAVPQQQASDSAIVPLPRPRPVVNAVPLDRPRHRTAHLGEAARSPTRSPLLSLFHH